MDNWPNFDELQQLASENPQDLEAWRLKEVEKIIARAPEKYRRRLRGLQFEIDCERTKHTSAMGACIAISQRMHESLHALSKAILNKEDVATHLSQPKGCAQIIDFPKRA